MGDRGIATKGDEPTVLFIVEHGPQRVESVPIRRESRLEPVQRIVRPANAASKVKPGITPVLCPLADEMEHQLCWLLVHEVTVGPGQVVLNGPARFDEQAGADDRPIGLHHAQLEAPAQG